MLHAMMISAIIFATAPAADPLELPPWPDLPAPIVDARGLLLPPATADEIHRRLLLLEEMPGICRVMIAGAVKIGRARCLASRVEAVVDARGSGWPTWLVGIAVGVAAFAAGFYTSGVVGG